MKRYANLYPHEPHGLSGLLRWKLGFYPPSRAGVFPEDEVQSAAPVAPDWTRLAKPDPAVIQATWIGHASFLVQVGGLNLLFDPVFSTYCSPVPARFARRVHPPGIPFEELPRIDAVFISHSHYDHLDRRTIQRLGSGPQFWIPAGLRYWFSKRGITKIEELGWWESKPLGGGMQATCVPAQHFSARTWFDHNRSLWCGWVVRGNAGTLYFVGDTGYCPVFAEIGGRLGPMTLSIIPIGCYEPRSFMKPLHVNPDEAVQIHLDVASRLSLASHWGVFPLTQEPLSDPPRVLRRALKDRGIPPGTFLIPRIGETVCAARTPMPAGSSDGGTCSPTETPPW